MIRKLRYKLIAVSMLSLVIVLVAIIGTSNILNYRRIINELDGSLTMLKDLYTKFDSENAPGDPPLNMPDQAFDFLFFSVLLDENGEYVSTDVEKTHAASEETAKACAERAIKVPKDIAFAGTYRYLRYDEDGGTRIIFLDSARQIMGFRAVLLICVIICSIGLLAVFLLIVLFSHRIVKPISQTYEKQKRFITDAGHEIKTPITIIDADAELLEMEYGSSEWIADIRSQSKRLADLTNDLICLSRMEEAGDIPMIDFPISDLVAETASSFQSLARTQNKHFTLEVEPMLSYCGNEKNIRQLVTILLDNAMKYSSDNGSITLKLEETSRAMVLTVTNTVDFISKETLKNMFDRFYRGDSSRSSRGYGIGLSIARAIVTAHKGKIRAESKDGKMLEMTVSLPI